MNYRSKRTMSTALATDASERPKRATHEPVVAASTTATQPATPATATAPAPVVAVAPVLSSSKSPFKWGPFGPPVDGGKKTSWTPESTPSSSKSIWKTIPAPSTTKPSNTTPSTTKPSTTTPSTTKPSNTIPSTTKPSNTIPSTTKPSTTKPSTTTPSITKPSTTKPLAPSTKNPLAPSTTKTPASVIPSTTSPPSITKHPSTTKAPTSKPPTSKPPTSMSKQQQPENATRNRPQNGLHSATCDFPCDNTYDAMQQAVRNAKNMGQQNSDQQTSCSPNMSNKPPPVKSRLRISSNGWPIEVEYNAKEEVATIDANGKVELISGPIQPIDVLSANGRRYFVEFNELHQPIRKGGHILVRFLGYIARMGNYCTLGALTWRNVEKKLKTDITGKMREHFIIPNDGVYDKLALQRVDKYWRHYKHDLKKTFFKPDKKTQEEHYDLVPSGHSRNDWIKLVNYWFSEQGQKLSKFGKEARSLQCQLHIMGAGSYANLRADYEAEHGKSMGLIEAWERSHMRKDGSFVEGTATEDFLHDVKSKVDWLKLRGDSTCEEDLEEEAFHDVMNGGEIPERPQGFGFGVKKSDVYGVPGLIRKQGYGKGKIKVVELDVNSNNSSPFNKSKEDLEKRNEELTMKYTENNNLLKTVVTQFSDILDAMRNGKASSQLIDAAHSALVMATKQVGDSNAADATSGDGSRSETTNVASKS